MRQIFPDLSNRQLFLDKAHCDVPLAEELMQHGQVTLHTPRKKKNQADIGADAVSRRNRLISTAVSRVRQPVESFFNWIDRSAEAAENSYSKCFQSTPLARTGSARFRQIGCCHDFTLSKSIQLAIRI